MPQAKDSSLLRKKDRPEAEQIVRPLKIDSKDSDARSAISIHSLRGAVRVVVQPSSGD